ncbi:MULTISPECIES: DUF4843 domain-containing protein [Sphingobacterium]|uniref:DUF4843 domain-containing protein n=1 Tax=Sphingobacterium tenebrionis TaxID=3111775 RepID=A0ABU8I2K5_9SPHI|nr:MULTISPECIES: DUF4843 domain-containing protein [unclassified Sphingobacterium]QBR13671.1 DUF4843 domain-containing protein [Sphingobacterium sp. CZ-2]
MKNWTNIFGFLCSLLFLIGCSEDKPLMYQEDSKVYFLKNTTETSRDSIEKSFAFDPTNVTSDTIALNFRIIGFPKDVDREIAVKVKEGSTAKLGYHFKIDNLFIPANSSNGSAELIFFRREGLKDSTVRADLLIAENENFEVGYEDVIGNSKINRVTLRFSITDLLSKPTNWQTLWQNMFGDYSNTKILFLTQQLNYTAWNVPYLFPQDQSNMINKARIAIYEYEKMNGPLMDENGNRVIIP